MTQIEFIDFRLIDESPLNPRKNFDETSIIELAENIKQQGLLQPITVRVYPEKKLIAPKELKGKICYQIVCGARRYKAGIKAGIKEIPAIVREMTDDQAFDAMITENLQRRDVEPMEEARAFAELNHRGTSFEELAARFGKSVSFIRQRIKLNDLIPEFIQMLDKKELQISHAQELCKLTPDYQTTLFNDKYSENAGYYKWNDKAIKDIKQYIQGGFANLDGAIFDKAECQNCNFRCGANALFSEYSEDKCTQPACFEEKTFNFRIDTAIQKSKDGFILVKREDDKYNKKDEVVNELEKRGYIFIENDYKTIDWQNPAEIPEMPIREDDDTDEQWAETLADYEYELKEYEKDLVRDKEKLEGTFKKGWFIGYWGTDEYKLIRFKDSNVSSPEDVSQEKALSEIKEKAKRNEELKNEKTIEDLRKLMSESKYQELDTPISEAEKVAILALILKNSGYNLKRDVENDFNKDLTPFENIRTFIGTPIETKILRQFIKHNSTDGGVTYEKGTQSVLKAICREAFPEDATKIELKHEETYLKRKENIDKQLKELSEK